jgi:hypothetical protein
MMIYNTTTKLVTKKKGVRVEEPRWVRVRGKGLHAERKKLQIK